MNYTGLELVTAPASAVVDRDTEVKPQLRIDHTDDDAVLTNLISAATDWVEDVTGRKLVTQTWTVYFADWPDGDEFRLPHPPLQSVTHVKYYETDDTANTLSATTYDVDTSSRLGVIRLKYGESWPTVTLRPTKAIEIQFVCGYSSIPDALKQAVILQVAQLYDGDSPLRAAAIERLLAPYVTRWY